MLAAAAALKLASPRSSHEALATFGVPGGRIRWAVWSLVVAAELGLAAGVALGSATAAYLAAALLAGFAVAHVVALRRGRAGAPCA